MINGISFLNQSLRPKQHNQIAHPINFTSKVPQTSAERDKRSENISYPAGDIYRTTTHRQPSKTLLEKMYFESASDSKANPKIQYDKWTNSNTICAHNRPDKKWVSASPKEALNRSLSEALNSNLTLIYGKDIPKKLPKNIRTPDYGDNWGRHCNYIEINNRALGAMQGNRTSSSIINTIKLLPLIPPSHDKWANCILISQLYPNIWGDGWNNNGENSLYSIKLEYERLSDNIGYQKIGGKVFTPEEQVRVFNDIAHLRGFKTSFRMLISEDQIKLGDSGQFRWDNEEHLEAFIIACCKGIELGFDGIFFDSAKHVGGYDWQNYAGVGAVPDYEQMSYILNEIRKRTGRFDLSFSGEKAENDSSRYKNMGLNAGTGSIDAQDMHAVKNSAKQQRNCREFAWGPVVSDDNDIGVIPYEERLRRITSALYGYDIACEKLPSFMQMNDLFPLNYSTNTHLLMLENRNFSTDNTPEDHYNNLFACGKEAKKYTDKVMKEFQYCYEYGN